MEGVGPRTSLDTADLLAAAVLRAGHVRTELIKLREHATSAASSAPASSTHKAATSGGDYSLQLMLPPAADGSEQAPMVLPVVLRQQLSQATGPRPKQLSHLQAFTLHDSANGGSGGHMPALLEVGGLESPGLSSGERRAAPKSSGHRIGGQHSSFSSGTWSIASSRHQPGGERQLASSGSGRGSPMAAGAAAQPHRAAAGGSAFEDVIAALRAESMQEQQLLPASAGCDSDAGWAAGGGSMAPEGGHSRGSGGASWGGMGSTGSAGHNGGSSSSSRTQRLAGIQQQQRQRVGAFDATEAERQLREKLQQVNAAKRCNDARMRPVTNSTPAATPRPSVVPRLPLALLSRPSSAVSSLPGSARLSGRENAQYQRQLSGRRGSLEAAAVEQEQQQQQGGHSPPRPVRQDGQPEWSSRQHAGSSADIHSDEYELASSGANEPLLAQVNEHSRSRAGDKAGRAEAATAAAPLPPSARRETHISLASLLAMPGSSSSITLSGVSRPAVAAAQSSAVGLRHSSFSVADAATGAVTSRSMSAAAPLSQHADVAPADNQADELEVQLPSHAQFLPVQPDPAAAAAAAPGNDSTHVSTAPQGKAAVHAAAAAAAVGAAGHWPAGPSHGTAAAPEVAAAPWPASTAAAATAPDADVWPGETAVPPMQDTPRHPSFTAETPRVTVPGTSDAAVAPPSANGKQQRSIGKGGLVGRILGRLASPFGKLQSPPATPLDAGGLVAGGAADTGGGGGGGGNDDADEEQQVASAASSASSSSGQAGSSPECQQRRQQQASPVRGFPALGDATPGDPEAGCRHVSASQLPPLLPQRQPQQQQAAAAAGLQPAGSGGGGASLAAAGSAGSIGRKRSVAEVGCMEGPASVKKHSPEISGSRLLPRTAELGGIGAAVAAPAAVTVRGRDQQLQQQQQQQQGGETGILDAVAELFGDEPRQQPVEQQQAQPCGQQPAATLSALPADGSGAAAVAVAAGQRPKAGKANPASGREDPSGSSSYRSSRLVMPVLLLHSPVARRQQPLQHWQEDPAQAAAAAAASEAPAAAEAQQAAAAAVSKQQRPPRPAAKEGSGSSGRPPQAPEKEHQRLSEGEQKQHPGGQRAMAPPQQQAAASAAPAAVRQSRAPQQHVRLPPVQPAAADRQQEQQQEAELPSESCWVDQQRQQQQHGDEQQELESTSVLISSQSRDAGATADSGSSSSAAAGQQQGGCGLEATLPVPRNAAAAGGTAAVCTPQAQRHQQLPLAAAAAAAGLTPRQLVAAAAFTPRRRLASLEPPEVGLHLRDDAHGKELLARAPELASLSGGALLVSMGKGCTVHKAWVKPNFKQGGSVRSIQLAAGSGGRAEMLYPSGLFRKPLRFAVKRAVLSSAAWRPGAYVVLDTARGMLRLEPGTAAEYARWVLALNAAFLASGAAGGGSSRRAAGGDGTLLVVGDMPWSAGILFG